MSKLNNTQIKNAKGRDKPYSLTDGLGLSLLINPNGAKWWRFRYRFEDKAKMMSLGTYPDTGLAAVRKKLAAAREKVAAGVNPVAQKKSTTHNNTNTFRIVAAKYLAYRKDSISIHHYKRSESLLRLYAFPFIGDMPITDIIEEDVKKPLIVLDDDNKKESATKLYGVLKQVFTYAKGRSFCKVNICSQFELNEIVKDHVKKHFATITKEEDIKKLMNNIDGYQGSIAVKCALQFMAFTALRSANVRHARWEQVDFEAKTMTIAKEEMKIEKKRLEEAKDFILPLSQQAVAVLKEVRAYSGQGKYIFPSNRGDRPLSENAMLAAIRNLGYEKGEFTPHGFRSMFSTIANEKGDFYLELIDSQLSHVVGNTVSGSYNRTNYFEKRISLVQWWGDWLDEVQNG